MDAIIAIAARQLMTYKLNCVTQKASSGIKINFINLEVMVNFFERILQHPQYYRQFNCGGSLITAFNCPMEARLMKTRFADL